MDAPAFSLFDHEEEVVRRAETMIDQLHGVAGDVRTLADAYRDGLQEQRRLVRFSDRMQSELQKVNERLTVQAEELRRLNMALTTEIGHRRKLEEELRRLAMTDGLTGAFNRRHFLTLAQGEADRCLASGLPLSLLLMDLDHFKKVNDRFGHAAGDDVLFAFSAACRAHLPESGVFGRIGGEEFCAILPETALGDAVQRAEVLRQAFASDPVEHQDQPVLVTVSIGVAAVRAASALGTPVEEAMARADRALYAAKHGGRNRVESETV